MIDVVKKYSEEYHCVCDIRGNRKPKNIDALSAILMAIQIDITNTVDSFETVFALDPFDKHSLNKVKKRVD